MSRIRLTLALCAAVTLAGAAFAAPTSPAQWPQFRGIDGAGVADGSPLPVTWSKTENVLWHVPVPGKGWSSPVVWGNRIYLTTAIPAGTVEKPWIPEKMEDNGKGYPTTAAQRWTLLCLDLKSGRKLWQREAHAAVPDWLTHPKGSHASETPVTDGKRIYAVFGSVGLFCYSMEGKPLWSRRWGKSPMLFNWGTAIGPAVVGNRVFVVNDNEAGSWLLCLDAATGKEQWKLDRAEKSNWCNPLIWRHGDVTELVTSGSKVVRSYDLAGKLLWELKGMSYATIPSPFVYHDRLYIASGHASGPTTPIYCIKPGASGDISLKAGEAGNASVQWCDPKAGPTSPRPSRTATTSTRSATPACSSATRSPRASSSTASGWPRGCRSRLRRWPATGRYTAWARRATWWWCGPGRSSRCWPATRWRRTRWPLRPSRTARC